MNIGRAIPCILLSFFLVASRAESVPLDLIFLAPQVFPAVDRDSTFGDFRMSISGFPDTANHELAVATDDHGFSHEGFFLLEDPTIFTTVPILFVLDIPPFRDLDEDGLHDFYDTDWALENVTTEGLHDDGFGGAREFTATWNRPEGTLTGTVTIDLPFIGRRFTHDMTLQSFAGAYEFTRQGTNLTGTVALTNTAAELDLITGPLSFAIVDPLGILEFRGDKEWRGPADSVYRYSAGTLERVSTNHLRSFLVFEDGQPFTGEADYFDAVLMVRSGDKNGNGVIDLVENSETNPPSLSIERIEQGVRVTINGESGGSYDLETASDVAAAQWDLEQTVALTGGQASVTNALSGTAKFFRLREN